MRLNSTTLAALRFFDVAARRLSFSRAAAELCVTQGAVSHQIKYLEESLGSKLFYRLPKQVKLTEEGEQFAKVVARALKELDEGAEAFVAPTRSTIDVRLRAGPSFALRWLVPRLGSLCEGHPNIKLHVIGAYGYFDPVNRDFDLAVEFVQASLPALHTEVLMHEHLTPVCSPEYLTRHQFLNTPADLARCTLLHDGDAWASSSEDAEWRYWLSEVGALEVDSNQGQFFSLANMAIEAALAHQGVAMGRLSLVEDLLAQGRLVSLFSHLVKTPARYCLVYPSELADRPGVRAVIEWLRSEAEKSGSRSAQGKNVHTLTPTPVSQRSATSSAEKRAAPLAITPHRMPAQMCGRTKLRLKHW